MQPAGSTTTCRSTTGSSRQACGGIWRRSGPGCDVADPSLDPPRSVKVGRVRTCRIEPKALSLAEQWINQRRAEWEQHFDQLGEYLNTLVKGKGTHAKDK